MEVEVFEVRGLRYMELRVHGLCPRESPLGYCLTAAFRELGCGRGPKRRHISGGNYGKGTPVPIPNTAVKLSSADDTEVAASWENRSLPDIHQGSALNRRGAFVLSS